MEIKVIEPIKNYLKEFNSPVEFNLWYAKNKDDVNKLTTHKLNKMYHIVGYRITKIKGVLMLKEDTESHRTKLSFDDVEELKDEMARQRLDIDDTKVEVEKIKETVNKLINFINTNYHSTQECQVSANQGTIDLTETRPFQ